MALAHSGHKRAAGDVRNREADIARQAQQLPLDPTQMLPPAFKVLALRALRLRGAVKLHLELQVQERGVHVDLGGAVVEDAAAFLVVA